MADEPGGRAAGLRSGEGTERRFSSHQLHRARRVLAIERDFDANPEMAAFVVDLIEELQTLRAQR